MNWVVKCLKMYAVFSGRARRQEFWMFLLFYCIVYAVAAAIDLFLGLHFFITALCGLAFVLPYLGVFWRRMHDIGKSGLIIFVGFIPAIGTIWLFILLIRDSQPGENQYGPNPKEA
ncbi:MAG: DUF805 domain-containing protein [Deferribacteraceae bacterium]|jgi:uncharacterized membrane protein YhaH (DUF805 family)|nr:DUF805 domain-containing protein [Deferribacteraceae bacterium]